MHGTDIVIFIPLFIAARASNSGAANTAMRKLAVSLADSSDLRVILSVFYTMVEVIRYNCEDDPEEYKQVQEEFNAEISKKSEFQLLNYLWLIFWDNYSPANWRWTVGSETVKYGDEVLQWLVSPFPHEEGATTVMESASRVIGRNEGTTWTEKYGIVWLKGPLSQE